MHATSAASQLLRPVATTFKDSWGKTGNYFLKNNPWKFSASNSHQKIYRYCIICGDDRFTNESWSKLHSLHLFGAPPTICQQPSCWDKLAFVPAVVSDQYLYAETAIDRTRAKTERDQEFCEDIQPETLNLRPCDKVYPNEADIPEAYVEVFKRLEEFPVETRIYEIDHVYFEYKKKNNIDAMSFMIDTFDPFLRTLVRYRKESVNILKMIQVTKKLVSKL